MNEPKYELPSGLELDTEADGAPALRRASSGRMVGVQNLYHKITAEVAKVYVGQDELVLSTLVALFSGGHVLIERRARAG